MNYALWTLNQTGRFLHRINAFVLFSFPPCSHFTVAYARVSMRPRRSHKGTIHYLHYEVKWSGFSHLSHNVTLHQRWGPTSGEKPIKLHVRMYNQVSHAMLPFILPPYITAQWHQPNLLIYIYLFIYFFIYRYTCRRDGQRCQLPAVHQITQQPKQQFNATVRPKAWR